MSITSKIPEISKIPYKQKCLRIRYYTQYWNFRSIEWLVNMWTHKVHAPLKCPPPIWTNLRRFRIRRIATSCHQKTAVYHLRAETGVLPLRAHLGMCFQQSNASAFCHHRPSRSSPHKGYPQGLKPQNLQRPAREQWRPQSSHCHLGWRPKRERLLPGQTPFTRPDDWGDNPDSGTQQKTLGLSYLSSSSPSF